MFNFDAKVKIPFLWGKTVFTKSSWSRINLIVGPNGSGKTLLAQSLCEQFLEEGFSVRFIKSDEIEHKNQYVILKNDEKIRTKIEKVLSNMFGKSIQFIEDYDHTLIPVVTNKAWNSQYMLDSVECHGLKTIISLLINLYSKSNNSENKQTTKGECIFFDEPELHLNPQLQTFFMNEIRKEVSWSSRKIFFLITHSPFFIDLRTPEDLMGVIVCHINLIPSSIDSLNEEDENLFRRFLPRFNSYHKQFFFSDNQIFVEGYTDQQMFTHLLPYIENESFSAGSGIIDVGGKDELGVFCKVCSLLGTNSRIITDLDSLFSGKLRDVVSVDERVCSWLEKQKEKQETFYKSIFSKKELSTTITLDRLIRKLEILLIEIGKEITSGKYESINDLKKNLLEKKVNKVNEYFHLLKPLLEKLEKLNIKHEKAESVDTYKTVLLQSIKNIGYVFEEIFPNNIAKLIPIVKNLTSFILAATETARVYILSKGCIEHYYTQNNVLYMPVSAKDKLFRLELEHIQNAHKKIIKKQYSELIEVLEKACSK